MVGKIMVGKAIDLVEIQASLADQVNMSDHRRR